MYLLLHDTTRYVYTVAAVTLVPSTTERAGCSVHSLLCTAWLPTTLLSVVLVVAVLLAFEVSERLGRRRERDAYRYTVTTRMTPARRWAAERTISCRFINCEGQSHKTVSTDYNLFEEKVELKRNQPDALLLTGLHQYKAEIGPRCTRGLVQGKQICRNYTLHCIKSLRSHRPWRSSTGTHVMTYVTSSQVSIL